MASISFCSLPICTTTNKPFSFPESSLTHSKRRYIPCKAAASADNNESPPESSFERRNLLLGLGGLYGAANIPSAFGAPIQAPDSAASCFEAFSSVRNPSNAIRGLACCPPLYSKKAPVDYILPSGIPVRVRPVAHKVSADYIKKFNDAVLKMKALPDDDPHSWKNQAKIHCAYCNGGYRQEKSGFPDLEIQVHNSWLFLPFHRWYLYFLEKIMGKVLEDDTFALPYWNWDNPKGMMLPALYEGNAKDPKNALFDPFREQSHLPPAIFDFNYGGRDLGIPSEEQISINLALMYRQMISTGFSTRTFMGGEVKAGIDPLGSAKNLSLGGSLENGVHTGAHRWVGNSRMPNGEDMGNFYSAGFDPVFYGHHANVDRMWNVWKVLGEKLGRKGHVDPVKDDWLNASYVFYDENRERVRVYNKHSVNSLEMGYKYEESDAPWVTRRPVSRPRTENAAFSADVNGVRYVKDLVQPVVTLDKETPVSFLVTRTNTNIRSAEDKKNQNEMLFLNGIKYNCEKFVRFNVFVNVKLGTDLKTITAAQGEFVGSFAQLPHNHGGGGMLMTVDSQPFGITELLEDTQAEQDPGILVTIEPKEGCEGLIITGMDIQMVDAEGNTELTKPEEGEFKL